MKAFLSGKKSKRQEFKRLRDDIESKRGEFSQVQSQLAAAKAGTEVRGMRILGSSYTRSWITPPLFGRRYGGLCG
jgi:hypothetical protein